jgi:hypothetical protein
MSVQKLQMASHAKQRREVLSESRMREICLSGSMSGERKRSVAKWPKLPRLSSTLPKADKLSQAKIQLCLLWSKSGQTRARLECPLSAISGLMHRSKQNLYSITSSANNRNDSGIVRPSVLAVFRLTTSWNLVGSCTGSSPGFAPRRMRSTYDAASRTVSI